MHLRNQTHINIDTVYLIGNSDEPNSLMRLGILFLLLQSKKRGMGGSERNLLKDIGDDRIKVSIVGCPVGSSDQWLGSMGYSAYL